MRAGFAFTSLSSVFLSIALLTGGCKSNHKEGGGGMTFGDDVQFLKGKTQVIVLSDSAGKAKVAVAPDLQGRVMTSTADGDAGPSFGWINRQYFDDAATVKVNEHISPYGGEDRFWLGPEGGQFAIFFKKGDPFDYEHWHTPRFIDIEPFDVVTSSADSARF